MVLDTEGHILTNNHVVDGYDQYVVTMDDGTTYEAEFVGNDASSDLAVIKLKDADASKLTPIEIGDSSKLNVGEWVMAIGSPFGNEQSVSTGIVSALYRSTAMSSTSGNTIYANMIQTDAAINPGNSGGALVNMDGKVIGINSAKIVANGVEGIGLAIPSNAVQNVISAIMEKGYVPRPYLGVSIFDQQSAARYGYQLNLKKGVYIFQVVPGGPADQAGLRKGDVIAAIDGDEVKGVSELRAKIAEHSVGDKIELTVQRGNQERKASLTLEEMPQDNR